MNVAGPGPLRLLIGSRKAVLVGLVFLVSTVYALGVVLAAYKGKIGWEPALLLLLGPLTANAMAAITHVWSIATEDSAEKAARREPSTVTATAGVVEAKESGAPS